VFNQPGVMIQLRDNIDEANLLSKTSLYSLGDIEFWVMKFEGGLTRKACTKSSKVSAPG
jgi:hypothetical protein